MAYFMDREVSQMHITRVEVLRRLAAVAIPLFVAASVLAQPKTLEEAMSYDGLHGRSSPVRRGFAA